MESNGQVEKYGTVAVVEEIEDVGGRCRPAVARLEEEQKLEQRRRVMMMQEE